MSKFAAILGSEQAPGLSSTSVASSFLSGFGVDLASFAIQAGAGALIHGLGTLLSKGPTKGFATTERNPTAPWKKAYGQTRVGGTIVYVNSWPKPGGSAGGNDQMLDMVIVLAAHAVESIDNVLFDMQQVAIDVTKRVNTSQSGSGAMNAGPYAGTGTSYNPAQQTTNITQIQRANGVVTVTLPANIPTLIEGDRIQIEEDGTGTLTAAALIGTFLVDQIISQVVGDPGSIVFTYLSGGSDVTITGHGHINTLWAQYGNTIYYEPMLGGQSLGQSFQGMVFGTPLDADLGDIVTPDHTGGVQGQNQPNPWTSNCSLVGKTAVMIRLHYDSKYYTGGIPQISFLIHGKNDILDPRTSPPTIGYSANAALCIADFLATPIEFGGYGLAYGTQIPYADLVAAANTCDEAVPLAYSLASPPLTEPAYECNGTFELSSRRGEILQNMLTSCAGRITEVAGQFVIWPAAWIGNSIAIGSNPGGGVIPLGDFNPIASGPIRWRPSSSGRDLYNGCKGTYISKSHLWTSTDFPPYCQDEDHGYGPGGLTPAGSPEFDYDASLEADGGDRRWLDIQLPFTTSPSAAQRIAKIELLRRRTPAVSETRGTGTLALNMIGYQVATLDLMLVTIPYLGWSAKQLEVTANRLQVTDSRSAGEGSALIVELDVQETDPTIYNWSTLEELSPEGYVQPVIPGVGPYSFTATETVPGFNVPFPWSPGYMVPLIGDAIYTGPVDGSVSQAKSTFGLQVMYDSDAQGDVSVTLDVQGTDPPNELSSLNPPQITCVVGTAGSLPAGNYLVAASIIDSLGFNTQLSMIVSVSIPLASPPVFTGSIAVTVNYSSPLTSVPTTPYTPTPGSPNSPQPALVSASPVGAEVYMGINYKGGKAYAGLSRQGTQLAYTTPSVSYTITDFDQSQPGAPDPTADHYAIAMKKVIHAGVFDQQVYGVTSNTVTLGGAGMGVNQWAGYTLSLVGKLDSTQELIALNMPVESNTTSVDSLFTLTIGNNSTGHQLPDLTTLLVVGDLVSMRLKPTFTATSFSDPNTANPYYPQGDTGIEAIGAVALVLTGPDAGDAPTINAVSLDVYNRYTVYELAAPWAIMPNGGDLVIIVEALWGPEYLTHTFVCPLTNSISGIVAAPVLQNLAGQSWVVIVYMQNAADDNGADMYCPVRDFYVFGSQGTRTITMSQSMLFTDAVIDFDASAGPITYTCLPFSQVPNQKFYFQKIDSSTNAVTINTFAAPDPAFFMVAFNVPRVVTVGSAIAPPVTLTSSPTILQVYANIVSAPLGSAITLEVKKNGSNWAALTIPAGGLVSNIVLGTSIPAVTTGDILSLTASAVGSVNPGTNMQVIVQFTGGDTDTINGVTQIVLPAQWNYLEFAVSAQQ